MFSRDEQDLCYYRVTRSYGLNIMGKNNSVTPLQESRQNYEKNKRGKVVMRVQLTPSDNEEEWIKIKEWLVSNYGESKKGIYELAKKAGALD